ncbi:MAG: bis(5'-nucleosyl)-tetraphosphatase (symmetrical) YqeK [Lachnospira sp.]
MNNEYADNIRKKVKKALKPNKARYWHSIGVANTCACLAMRYNLDVQDAYVAGLLHDCAKCFSDDELLALCSDNNIEISEYEQKSPYLLHGKLGAYYADTVYGVKNKNIQDAILYHTTGRADMSLLEEIVFIADYIEPFRNRADNLEIVRNKAFTDIKEAVYIVARDTIEYLKERNRTIEPHTIETYHFYKQLFEK